MVAILAIMGFVFHILLHARPLRRYIQDLSPGLVIQLPFQLGVLSVHMPGLQRLFDVQELLRRQLEVADTSTIELRVQRPS